MDATRELVAGGTRPDHFADGKSEQVADTQRCGKRKGTRAASDDGMEIERYLHSDHGHDNFCRIEELPAAKDK